MVPDIFVGSALELDGDEREWVPQSDTVAFRPLILNVTQGYYVYPSAGSVLRRAVAPPPFRTGARLNAARQGGTTSSTTGSRLEATMRSSRPARPTPWSFLTTFRKWRRCST